MKRPTPIPYWIAGRSRSGTDVLDVISPHDGGLAGRTTLATDDDVETAVCAAAGARAASAATPAHVRAAALDHVSRRLAERAEEFAALITAEIGKPMKWSRRRGRPGGLDLPLGGRGGAPLSAATLQRLDTDPAGDRPTRPRPALPARAGARHRAVQLPAQPGGAQGRPGDRGRRADRASSRPPRRR